jgi:hypothetical protein
VAVSPAAGRRSPAAEGRHGAPRPSGPVARIAFLGDISLNDRYRELAAEGIDPFRGVAPLLRSHDHVIGNLEAMALGSAGENLLKKPRLATDASTLGLLRGLGLRLACLAHNHVYDHLLDGFLRTTGRLEELGINFLGAGATEAEARRPHRLEIHGIRFGFLNYVAPDTNPKLPEGAGVHLNLLDDDLVVEDLRRIRPDVDVLVLLLHWGGKVEGGFHPHYEQRAQARRFVEAGADLIVGHHTHTLQPFESFDGRYVFYGLGNFCFADVVSDGALREIDWTNGAESMILSVSFHRGGYSFETIPISNRSLIIERDDSIRRRYMRRLGYFRIIRSSRVLWYLYFLKCRYLDRVRFYFWGNGRRFGEQLRKLNWWKVARFLRG